MVTLLMQLISRKGLEALYIQNKIKILIIIICLNIYLTYTQKIIFSVQFNYILNVIKNKGSQKWHIYQVCCITTRITWFKCWTFVHSCWIKDSRYPAVYCGGCFMLVFIKLQTSVNMRQIQSVNRPVKHTLCIYEAKVS